MASQLPATPARLDRLRPALLAALGLLIYSGFYNYYFDDPFITFRVAENLARGQGFLYNPGPHLNATTSPLWTLILAGLHLGTRIPLPILAPALSTLLLVAAAELLARALNLSYWRTPAGGAAAGGAAAGGAADPSRASIATLAAIFTVLNPHFAMTAGMETMLVFALALAALLAYQRERWTLTALLLSLAILARMDAGIVAAILAGHFLLARKRFFPWPATLAFLVPLALWFGFSLLYFHQLLPSTLAVKIAQRQSGAHWGAGFIFLHHLGQILRKEFFFWDPLNLLLLALLGLGCADLIRNRSLAGLVILAWAAGHTIAYGLFLNVPAYDWYFAPVFLLLTLALAAGAVKLVFGPARLWRASFFLTLFILLFWAGAWFGLHNTIIDKVLTPAHLSHFFFYLALLPLGLLAFTRLAAGKVLRLIVLVLVAAGAIVPRNWNGWLQAETFPPAQYRNYRLAAEWIGASLSGARSVGADEIGILGYYLPDRVIVDQCGIPTPGAAERLARGDYTWWILRYRPAALVLHPARDWWWQVEGPLKEAEWFGRAYRLRATLEADRERPPWGKHAVEIWQKVDDDAIPRVGDFGDSG